MTTTTDTSTMTLAQKSDHILAKTRGLSGATPSATRLIEELRWALEANRRDVQRLTAERDEARRMVCELDADIREDQREYAKHMGWDCYAGDGK